MRTITIYKFYELNKTAQKKVLKSVAESTPYAFYVQREVEDAMCRRFGELFNNCPSILKNKLDMSFENGEGAKIYSNEPISGQALYGLCSLAFGGYVSPSTKRLIDHDMFGIHLENANTSSCSSSSVDIWAEFDNEVGSYPRILKHIQGVSENIENWLYGVCQELEDYMNHLYDECRKPMRVEKYILETETNEKYFLNGELLDW